MSQSKYRKEWWRFRTSEGVKTKLVCILAGQNERGRLLEKAKQMEANNGWKLL